MTRTVSRLAYIDSGCRLTKEICLPSPLSSGSSHTGLLTVNRQTNDPISTVVHILLSVFCKRGITGNYPCIRAPTREASVTITTQLITQRVPGVVVDRIDHMGRRRRVSAAFEAPMPQSLLLDVSAELDVVSEDR